MKLMLTRVDESSSAGYINLEAIIATYGALEKLRSGKINTNLTLKDRIRIGLWWIYRGRFTRFGGGVSARYRVARKLRIWKIGMTIIYNLIKIDMYGAPDSNVVTKENRQKFAYLYSQCPNVINQFIYVFEVNSTVRKIFYFYSAYQIVYYPI